MHTISRLRYPIRILSLLVLLAVILGVALPQATAALTPTEPAAPVRSTKLIVDAADAATLHQLATSSAQLLADYGSFSLWGLAPTEVARFAGLPSVDIRRDFDLIGLRSGPINTRNTTDKLSSPLRQVRTLDSQLWMVQFIGPIQDQWLERLTKLGLTPVIYMPQNAYVVWGPADALTALETLAVTDPAIQWTGAYHPAYRLAPNLQQIATTRPAGELVDVTVQLYTSAGVAGSLERLLAMGGQVYKPASRSLDFTNLTLQVPAGKLVELAGWADVYNVEAWSAPRRFDEAQGQIMAGNLTTTAGNVVPSGPGYLAWLTSKGFPTTASSYPVVDIVDDGIDNGTTNPLHPDFHQLGVLANPSRLIYNSDCTTDPSGNGVGGHGNINAGIVGSYNNLTGSPHQDAGGYRLGLGISPYTRLAGTKIFRNAGPYDVSACGNTDQGVVANSFNRGATMTSNSWGDGSVAGGYDASSQAYDALTRDASSTTAGHQQMLHVFANGNDGSDGPGSVGSPATAKNVLSVGATENVRDEGVLDGCNTSASNNADDLASFSSRGPADDGRIKPDIMAPGIHIQGPASQDPAFNGASVCGASGNKYYPPGQTLYTWSTGTSHSTPAVAGAASLVYEYYGRVLKPGSTPSPAMLKALLLNSPRYLNGSGTGGNLPTNNQGWGDVNLGTLFDGQVRYIRDQAQTFGATGAFSETFGVVASNTKPFRVSLVWTDAPGSTTGNAYVNDLNLEVTVGGQTYKGNVFTGADSSTGGAFDAKNNTENVFVPAGVTGGFKVRIVAANIAGDGVPGNADTTDQDFALVISNATVQPTVVLGVDPVTIAEVAGNGDSVVDPGETLSLVSQVQNTGNLAATGVSGQLTVVSGSATILSGSSAYPNIAPAQMGSTITPYRFRVNPNQPCGAVLVLRETITYNGNQSISYLKSIPIGSTSLGAVVNSVSTDVPKAIPDNNSAGVEINLPVTGSGAVGDINVRLGITHTWVSDLDILLKAPDGTTVALANGRGDNGDNYTGTIFDDEAATSISTGSAPFTGSFRPEAPLSALDGKPIAGTWKLVVQDSAAQDTGTVTSFSLDIRQQIFNCSPFGNSSSTYLPLVTK